MSTVDFIATNVMAEMRGQAEVFSENLKWTVEENGKLVAAARVSANAQSVKSNAVRNQTNRQIRYQDTIDTAAASPHSRVATAGKLALPSTTHDHPPAADQGLLRDVIASSIAASAA